ncbi:MAG: serine hydrolase domain-containing protein [Clostridium sp.]
MRNRIECVVKNKKKFNGVVLVCKDNDIIYKDGYGYSDKEDNKLNTEDTTFLICSVSKMFTALGIMKLYEEGKLDINEPVSKYLSDIVYDDDIKIGNLLNHTSNLKNFIMCRKQLDLYKYNSPRDIAKLAYDMRNKNKSLDKLSYNNSGYLMLALIIEEVSGCTYEEYISDNIFKKLNMYSSTFTSKTSEFAKCYSNGKEGRMLHSSSFYGCGDIVSTASDLLKFSIGLENGQVVSLDTLKIMQEIKCENKMMKYGYGFMINNKFGEESVGHSGSVPGGISTQLSFYKESGVHIIILCNDTGSISPFVPGVINASYLEKCIMESITEKKIGFMKKLI